MAYATLTTDQLEHEAFIAAELVHDAESRNNPGAAAEAYELFMQLLAELSRR